MLLMIGIAGMVLGSGLAIVAGRAPSHAPALELVGGALLIFGLLALGAAIGWAVSIVP
jgi:hypothetical protein